MEAWQSVQQVFTTLNTAGCTYAVLRNYECMFSENPFVNGHNDIDLICNNPCEVQKVLGTRKRFLFPTVNSYCIPFKDHSVNVDIRFVGDGYYDAVWEEEMLAKRKLFNNYIYVLDPQNYFYSLIYHAILQKPIFSDEYQKKLLLMAKDLSIPCNSPLEFGQLLEEYMLDHSYYYTVTRDPGIVLKFDGIEKRRIRSNSFWLFKRYVLDLLKRNRRIAQKYV